MSGTTEESARFKKAFQTVNGGDNNKTLDKNPNEEIFDAAPRRDDDQAAAGSAVEQQPGDSQIQKDLDTKGYTNLDADEETQEMKDMRQQLSK